MSLVAYDTGSSSDESDEERRPENVGPKIGSISLCGSRPSSSTSDPSFSNLTSSICKPAIHTIFKNLPEPKHCDRPTVTNALVEEKTGLFYSLPLPKSTNTVDISLFDLHASDKIVDNTANRKIVKITVPPLSKFKGVDSDEPDKKRVKQSAKPGSGLFSLLPAPKNVRDTTKDTQRLMVPHVLTKKPTSNIVTEKTANAFLRTTQKPTEPSLRVINYDSEEDSDDEEDGSRDFFSLNADECSDDLNVPETLDTLVHFPATADMDQSVSNDEPLAFVSGFQPTPWVSAATSAYSGPSWPSSVEPSTSREHSEVADYISVVEEDIQLDDEALQRLCGRRAKKQDMEFINVNGAEIMPDPKEWLVKQLSEEQPKMRSHKKHEGPTTQQRRKHQITYLAFQAKENELELKNQWSQNRMSRKQTQSKYGF